jgi:hypothetical protein
MMPNSRFRPSFYLTAGLLVVAGLGVGLTQVVQAEQIFGRQRSGDVPTFSGRAEAEAVAKRLYRATLEREAEVRGLTQATAEIQKGNLQQQINSMVASQEFRQKIARMTAPQILDQFYRGMLNRAPDQAGIDAFLPRMEQRQYAGVLLEMAGSPEFRETLGSTATSPVTDATTSRLETVLGCQARVLAAVSRDVSGRAFLSFDRMPDIAANGAVSGPAVDRFDNDRQMSYRCEGNSVTYNYSDRSPARGRDIRERFESVAVNNCMDAASNEFGGAQIRAASLSASDTNAEYVLGHAVGNNNATVSVVCQLDGMRVVSVRRR